MTCLLYVWLISMLGLMRNLLPVNVLKLDGPMDGDSNTHFFHLMVKEKQHSQQLYFIGNSAGTYVYDDDVVLAFVNHLKSFMGIRDDTVDPTMPSHLFQNVLSIADANIMIRPITDLDIRNSMFSIGDAKAPGSDDFSAKLFKSAWSVVG